MRVSTRMALTLLAVWLPAAAGAGDAREARAAAIAESTCDNDQHLQVTLALPADYLDEQGHFAGESARGRGAHQVCGAFAKGTYYQLVSWLENGAVQAAVLPSFAVSVMKADDAERFSNDYFVLRKLALPNLPIVERRLYLNDAKGQPIPDADSRLMDFFSALQQHETVSILLPSHLSPAVPFLIRSAMDWADRQELDTTRRETFYRALLAALRFGSRADLHSQKDLPTYELYDAVVKPERGATSEIPAAIHQLRPNLNLEDQVVVRKRVLMASKALREVVADAMNESEDKPLAIARPAPLFEIEGTELGKELTKFRETNYRRLQFGNVSQRHFRFTIPELWSQLERGDSAIDGAASQPGGLALVLTGGGVKAAYQTSLIDYLYTEGRLVNADKKRVPQRGTQQVNYVIGTSGGALLGVFVAAMDEKFAKVRLEKPENRLTAILWKEPGVGIRSHDVFPILDMMRYATLIAALIVVWLVAAFALEVFRKQFNHVTRIDHSEESFFGRRARAWKESWPWIVLLVFAPIVIVKVAGVNRVEHMPTETGLYYAWMALVAFYSDVRLSPKAPFEWTKARFTVRTVLTIVAGLACIGAALLYGNRMPGVVAVNLCCAGFVVLIYAVHLFFHDQKQFFEGQPRAPIFSAFVVLLALVTLSYLGVLLAMALEATSLLEMSGGFWQYFLALAALLTGALMWLGRANASSPAAAWAKDTVRYLFSEYRSRAMFGSERRFMRFMTLTVSAWLWWNLLAAPALYGNANAREYLGCAFSRFTELAHPDWKRSDCRQESGVKAKGVPFPLAVPFVITATSLQKGQERYFLFISGDDEAIDDSLDAKAWFNVVRDPRWVVVRKPLDTELKDAAFASGSPFPVFSAHDVELRVLRHKDRLIDGGFAHNKPLEAALALGASKVLVINSSPLPDSAGSEQCSLVAFNMGELACNLPKLVPYLWERSQVEDLLSTRNMMVASIYPTASTGLWPSLTDFRQKSVRHLLEAADGDKLARVGVIESWGAPNFDSIGLFTYDTDQIKATIEESQM